MRFFEQIYYDFRRVVSGTAKGAQDGVTYGLILGTLCLLNSSHSERNQNLRSVGSILAAVTTLGILVGLINSLSQLEEESTPTLNSL